MAGYRIDVRPFLDEIGGGVDITDTFDLSELVVGDETFVMVEPPSFHVNISNAGEAFVSVGRVTAHVKATCSRCLCDFDTTITGDVEGLWPRPGMPPLEDQDISGEVDSEYMIDLEPALVAGLTVEAPFAPLHDENCAGLCPTCGADLNEGPCSCGDAVDEEHPFAALQGLAFGDSEDSEDAES